MTTPDPAPNTTPRVEHFEAALEIYEELGSRREIARMLLEIALTTVDIDTVTQLMARSRALYAELGDSAGTSRVDAMAQELREAAAIN